MPLLIFLNPFGEFVMSKYLRLWAGEFFFLCWILPLMCRLQGFHSYFIREFITHWGRAAAHSPLYSRTTYVGQVMAYEHNEEPDATFATRQGEFAMLIYSIGQSC
jgi:hypothetical protein